MENNGFTIKALDLSTWDAFAGTNHLSGERPAVDCGDRSVCRAGRASARMSPIPIARKTSCCDDEVPDLVPEWCHGLSRRGSAGVADAAHAVAHDAKDAGVWVFGGGIDESVPPVLVGGDGTVTEGTYPQTKEIEGGYTVLELTPLAESDEIPASCGERPAVRNTWSGSTSANIGGPRRTARRRINN